MGDDTPITMHTWEDVFNQIHYCYEPQYKVDFWIEDGVEYVQVYKGTFSSDGLFEYKGGYERFDEKLWPRIKLFAKLFETNGTVDILYGDNK